MGLSHETISISLPYKAIKSKKKPAAAKGAEKGFKGIKTSVLVNGLSGKSIIQIETYFNFFSPLIY